MKDLTELEEIIVDVIRYLKKDIFLVSDVIEITGLDYLDCVKILKQLVDIGLIKNNERDCYICTSSIFQKKKRQRPKVLKKKVKKGRYLKSTGDFNKIFQAIKVKKGDWFSVLDLVSITGSYSAMVNSYLFINYKKGFLLRKKNNLNVFVYKEIEDSLSPSLNRGLGEVSDLVWDIIMVDPCGLFTPKDVYFEIAEIWGVHYLKVRSSVTYVLLRWFRRGALDRVSRGVYRLKSGINKRPITS